MRAIVLIFALVGAACAAEAREATARASLAANPGQPDLPAAEIEIDVAGEQTALWRGTLRVAGSNGYASFSQSKSEYVGACAGEGIPDVSTASSESLNFSLNRYNWQQNRDAFSINVNWVRPLPSCNGDGTTTVGFSRNITLAAGQTIELDGGNGLSVKLTRAR